MRKTQYLKLNQITFYAFPIWLKSFQDFYRRNIQEGHHPGGGEGGEQGGYLDHERREDDGFPN